MICRDGGWVGMEEVNAHAYTHTHAHTHTQRSLHDKSLSGITPRRQKSCKREEGVK